METTSDAVAWVRYVSLLTTVAMVAFAANSVQCRAALGAGERPASPGFVFGSQNNIVQHRQALLHKDVAAAVETVRASASASPAIKLTFEFLVLTAARSGEERLATWNEIDTAGRVCTISAARMAAKREDWVPLCGRALEILVGAGALRSNKALAAPLALNDVAGARG